MKTPIWPFVWLAWIVFWFLGTPRLSSCAPASRPSSRAKTATLAHRAGGRAADAAVARIARRRHIGSRRRVRLWESRLAPAPLSFGVLRPMIVLPTALAPELDNAQLRLVLKHEVAHVARRDHAWVLVERLAQAFFWWNVALRRVNRRLAQLREEICDDYASAEREDAATCRGSGENCRLESSLAHARLRGHHEKSSMTARDDLAGRVDAPGRESTSFDASHTSRGDCRGGVRLPAGRDNPARHAGACRPGISSERPHKMLWIAQLQRHGISVMDDWLTKEYVPGSRR